MASILEALAMASILEAMASNLIAMASILEAMASNLIAMASKLKEFSLEWVFQSEWVFHRDGFENSAPLPVYQLQNSWISESDQSISFMDQ